MFTQTEQDHCSPLQYNSEPLFTTTISAAAIFNQSTDSTCESTVSECSWENGLELGLNTVSFSP